MRKSDVYKCANENNGVFSAILDYKAKTLRYFTVPSSDFTRQLLVIVESSLPLFPEVVKWGRRTMNMHMITYLKVFYNIKVMLWCIDRC
jgi:hypothetical protein